MVEALDVTITSDPSRIDIDAVHAYLARSYWATGIPKEVVRKSLENSICFSAFIGDEQVGFARVVTDRATFAYLADVYVLEEHRGRGISGRLMDAVTAHPDLAMVRRFVLVTRDAHGLYAKFGFRPLEAPDRYMEIRRSAESVYGKSERR